MKFITNKLAIINLLILVIILISGIITFPVWGKFYLFSVGYTYWKNATNLLLSIDKIGLTFAYFALISIFIIGLINPIKKLECNLENSLLVFSVSYLAMIPIIRLLNILLGGIVADYLLLAFLIVVDIYIIYSKKIRFNFKLIGSRRGLLLLLFFMVYGIQIGPKNILGDGDTFFLNFINNYDFNSDKNFPIFSQHYDQIIFIKPLISLMGIEYALQSYWLTFSLINCSLFIILFSYINYWIKNNWVSALFTAVVFFGTLHPTFHHLLLFDAGNPLGLSPHPSRIILDMLAISLPILLIFNNKLENKKAIFIMVLLFMGLSSFYIHALIFAFVIPFLIVFKDSFCHSNLKYPILFANLSITLLLLLYYLDYSHSYLIYICYFLTVIYFLSLFDVKKIISFDKWAVKLAIIYIGFYLMGLLFFGQKYVREVYEVFNISNIEIIDRMNYPIILEVGKNKLCGKYPFNHCLDILHYVHYFGLVLLIVCIVQVFHLKEKLLSNSSINILFRYFLFSIALFFLTTLIYDFSNGQNLPENYKNIEGWLKIWHKSRLLEPWFYALIVNGGILIYLNLEKFIGKFSFINGEISIFLNLENFIGKFLFIFTLLLMLMMFNFSQFDQNFLTQFYVNLKYLIMEIHI